MIYHAAAYEHVPLMEEHVFEAIENNIFGTYNLAVAADESGVEDFVMISSDKLSVPQTSWEPPNASPNSSCARFNACDDFRWKTRIFTSKDGPPAAGKVNES